MLSMSLLDLSVSDILSDIPLDAGTFVVIALFLVFGFFVWYGSRSTRGKGPGTG